jgi:hypothetical protein
MTGLGGTFFSSLNAVTQYPIDYMIPLLWRADARGVRLPVTPGFGWDRGHPLCGSLKRNKLLFVHEVHLYLFSQAIVLVS